MSSKQGRKVQSWRSPPKAYLKCLATAFWDSGARGNAVVQGVDAIVPGWRRLFPDGITDNALVMRAAMARRYPNEAPENHRTTKDMWARAVRHAASGRRWTLKKLRSTFPDGKKATSARSRTSTTEQAEARA